MKAFSILSGQLALAREFGFETIDKYGGEMMFCGV